MLVLDTTNRDTNIVKMLYKTMQQNKCDLKVKDKTIILDFFKTPENLNVIMQDTTTTLLIDNVSKAQGFNKAKCQCIIILDHNQLDNMEASLDFIMNKYNIELAEDCVSHKLCSALSYLAEHKSLDNWNY